jgi:hypothetical protein
MKKNHKLTKTSLRLQRETLRELSLATDLQHVVGGTNACISGANTKTSVCIICEN